MDKTSLNHWFAREVLVHEAALLRYLARVWPNRHEIPDFRQDIYIRVYEAAKTAPPSSAKAFLFSTARNLLIDRVRRSRVVTIRSVGDFAELNVLSDEVTPERQFTAGQELELLARAFRRLPPREREVVWLRRVDELPQPIMTPATSDDFSSTMLGLQWQWNHNPDDSRWTLSERPGHLRLKATQSHDFWTARNTLIQKGQGPWSRGEVKLDLRNLQPGDVCGFGTLGKFSGHIAVNGGTNGQHFLSMRVIEATETGSKTQLRVPSHPIAATDIYLRTDMDFIANKAVSAYSLDGKHWSALGGEFELAYDWRTGTFQGEQYAIFCYNPQPTGGFVDVDSFRFTDRNQVGPIAGAETSR